MKTEKKSPLHAKTIISTKTSSSPSLLSVNPIKVVPERRAIFEANHPSVFTRSLPSYPPHSQHLGKLGFSK